MKERIPTEHQEQVLLMNWLEEAYPFAYSLTFAIPNGAHKSIAAAAKFKKEGLKKGVPDLFIAVPYKDSHGLFIEMKRQKGSVTSDAQKQWFGKLQHAGYQVCLCKGFQAAAQVVTEYFKND